MTFVIIRWLILTINFILVAIAAGLMATILPIWFSLFIIVISVLMIFILIPTDS